MEYIDDGIEVVNINNFLMNFDRKKIFFNEEYINSFFELITQKMDFQVPLNLMIVILKLRQKNQQVMMILIQNIKTKNGKKSMKPLRNQKKDYLIQK